MGEVKRYTNGTTGGPVFVDVKDGKILRITAHRLRRDRRPVVDHRGPGPDLHPAAQDHRLALDRGAPVDHLLAQADPHAAQAGGLRPQGRRGNMPEPRRLRLRAHQLGRGPRHGGRRDQADQAGARTGRRMLTTPGSHHMWGNVGYRHSAYFRFMNLVGFTYGEHNPDSWEGWHWGAMHMWGFSHRLGIPEQYDLLEDALKNTEMIVFWSADPEATCTGSTRPSRARPPALAQGARGQDGLHRPLSSTTPPALLADKWFAPRLGTDVAMALAIAYMWLTEGTYDKEYVADRTTGFDEWKDYVLGKTDGMPKTPEWAEGESGIPAREIRALAREWASKKTMLAAGRPGRHGRRLPRRHRQRVGPHHGGPGRHAGPGQAGQQHLGHHQRRARSTAASCSPATPRAASPATRTTRPPASAGSTACSPRAGPSRNPHHSTEGQTVAAPAHPRGHAPRDAWSGGARASAAPTSRASSRSTSTRPRATRRWGCTTATAAPSSAP